MAVSVGVGGGSVGHGLAICISRCVISSSIHIIPSNPTHLVHCQRHARGRHLHAARRHGCPVLLRLLMLPAAASCAPLTAAAAAAASSSKANEAVGVAVGVCSTARLPPNAPGRRRSLPAAVPLCLMESVDGGFSGWTTGGGRGRGHCQENLMGGRHIKVGRSSRRRRRRPLRAGPAGRRPAAGGGALAWLLRRRQSEGVCVGANTTHAAPCCPRMDRPPRRSIQNPGFHRAASRLGSAGRRD